MDGGTRDLGAERGVRLLFARLSGQPVAFCPLTQRLFALNETAAHVWCRSDDGIDPAHIAAELVGRGMSPDDAARSVTLALEQRRGHAVASPHAAHILDVVFGGVAIRIVFSDAGLRMAAARWLPKGDVTVLPHVILTVDRVASGVTIARGGEDPVIFPRDQLVPALKAALVHDVLARCRHPVALHAAALRRKGRALLLVGAPGAGKTTLALALAAGGETLLGDDLVLLRGDGMVEAVPFPAAVKPGAWPLVARFMPEIAQAEAMPRPDGIQVRYLPVLADPPALRVGWIVVPRRSGGPPGVTTLSPVEALEEIIAGGHARGGRMTTAGFRALAAALDGARCLAVAYDGPERGAALVREAAGP